MAYTTRSLSQQQNTFSVPRKQFVQRIVKEKDFSKKELRVVLLLLSSLNGYRPPESSYRGDKKDPANYKSINKKQIAKKLDMTKWDVESAIDKLLDYGIIEEGTNDTSKKGYRFTF